MIVHTMYRRMRQVCYTGGMKMHLALIFLSLTVFACGDPYRASAPQPTGDGGYEPNGGHELAESFGTPRNVSQPLANQSVCPPGYPFGVGIDPPQIMHPFWNVPAAWDVPLAYSLSSAPPGACPTTYYSSEPQQWPLATGAPAPQRGDGVPGMCAFTDGGGTWNKGICLWTRRVVCRYGGGATQLDYIVDAVANGPSWDKPRIALSIQGNTFPGCNVRRVSGLFGKDTLK